MDKQEEQQLKRELHETMKTCKYLQGQLKRAETRPPEKDPVIRRELDAARQRIAELERVLEEKRKQIEGYKEQLEPTDDLELRCQGTVAISVSRDGEVSGQVPPGEVSQFATMMSVMADLLGLAAEKSQADFSALLEHLLSEFVERPAWREALLNVASAIEDDDDRRDWRDPEDDEG